MQPNQIKIAYCRVSSADDRQRLGLAVQTEALAGSDHLYIEKHSGGDDNRKELAKALRLAKKLARDEHNSVTVFVYKLDRLTRRMNTLVSIIDDLSKHNVNLVSICENVEINTLMGRLICTILGFTAELELDNISQRTKDGLRIARERGVILGNKGIDKKTEEKILRLYQMRDLSIKLIAKRCGVCEKTVYNVAKRHNLSRK